MHAPAASRALERSLGTCPRLTTLRTSVCATHALSHLRAGRAGMRDLCWLARVGGDVHVHARRQLARSPTGRALPAAARTPLAGARRLSSWWSYSLTGLQDDGIDLGLTLDGFFCNFRTMHEEEALGARAPLAAVALWPWSRDGPLSHR